MAPPQIFYERMRASNRRLGRPVRKRSIAIIRQVIGDDIAHLIPGLRVQDAEISPFRARRASTAPLSKLMQLPPDER